MITPLDLFPGIYSRVLIAGGPKSGKTTLSDVLAGVYPVRHTDDLIGRAQWSEASEEVSRWMDEPGPWLIEGVATPRAIRKWMERSNGKPCDLLLWLDDSHAELSKGQAAMTKACLTVFAEVRAAAVRRGVVVVSAARSSTPAIPAPTSDDGEDDDDHADSMTAYRRDLEAARWYLELPAVKRRGEACQACATRVDVRTAAIVRGRRVDAKRIPLQAKPVQFENRYRKLLAARARDTHAVLTAALAKAMKSTDVDERATRTDDAQGDLRKLLQTIARVEKAVAAQPIKETEIAKLGDQLQLFTSKAVTKQIESVIAIDITKVAGFSSELLEAWVSKNLEIVSSMDAKYFEGATKAVTDAVTKGRSTDWLAAELADRYGVSESRASFIARDQIGSLNGQITEARQTSLGIEEYTWSTSGDQRVRPEHAALEGKTFKWADGGDPEEGNPGAAPGCRCGAIPVL